MKWLLEGLPHCRIALIWWAFYQAKNELVGWCSRMKGALRFGSKSRAESSLYEMIITSHATDVKDIALTDSRAWGFLHRSQQSPMVPSWNQIDPLL